MLILFAFTIYFLFCSSFGYFGIDKLEHYFKTLNNRSFCLDHAVPDPYVGLYILRGIRFAFQFFT